MEEVGVAGRDSTEGRSGRRGREVFRGHIVRRLAGMLKRFDVPTKSKGKSLKDRGRGSGE